jgi:hypothetical protein
VYHNTALTRIDNTMAAGLSGDALGWRRRDDQALQLQHPEERESQQIEGLTDVFALSWPNIPIRQAAWGYEGLSFVRH